MENKSAEKKPGIEINLQKLFSAILNKMWLVVLVAVVAAIVTFLGTYFFIQPQYQSAAMFYVNNSSFSMGDASFSITSSDITASKSLVKSYIVILQTRQTMDDIIDYTGVDRTHSQLLSMISAQSVDNTEIFRVVVESPDPQEAKKIADAISYILPKRISSIIEGTSAKVVDMPKVPVNPSSPSYTTNAIIGFLIGLTLTASVIVLMEIFDVTIRSEDDIAQNSEHPILASVPDMSAPTKSGYYYGYGSKKSDKVSLNGKQPTMVGKGIAFTATEAYNLLRTKLQFSFAGDNRCRVIAVSSAMSGEGKSLSAVNLAYSMSQLGKKVLLIDCDMRRPSLNVKLPIKKTPGLSNYLSGQCALDAIFQPCGIVGEENAFQVVSSGRNPPNPIELISSDKMSKMLKTLRQSYDYIILDMPPVGEVSDALAVAQDTDGVLLVVRQNYCNRVVLNDTIRQFEFMEAKILGIVCNCSTKSGGGYSKKYYRKYGSKYAGRYATAQAAAEDKPVEQEPAEE
ncbi:MAG: polysaccharide biosynthesis tyrosine autokinase [Ruminococcaceae bacterium]|nr:polysaccharide biosynthesis tyrosine autokinase [Oscillospiraceae bacterium]